MPRSRLPYKLLYFHNSEGLLIQTYQVSYLLFSFQQGRLPFHGPISHNNSCYQSLFAILFIL